MRHAGVLISAISTPSTSVVSPEDRNWISLSDWGAEKRHGISGGEPASPYKCRIRWNLQSASWPTLAPRTPASRPCVACRASSLTPSGTSPPWLLSSTEPSVRRPCVLTLRDFSLHLHRRNTLQCNVTISPLFAFVEHSEGVCRTGNGVCQRVR